MSIIEFPVYDWLFFKDHHFLSEIDETYLLFNRTLQESFVLKENTLNVRYEFAEFDFGFAIPFFLILISAEIFSQFITKKQLYRMNDTFSSLACLFTQQLIGKLFVNYIFRVIPYAFCFHLFHGGSERALVSGFDIGLTSWYWWFILVVYDHQYYWAHRYTHEWNIGWAAHNTHHSSEEYNLSTALRQGAYQDCVMFLFYIPMAIAGVHPYFFSLHANTNLICQFWFHTRAITKLPSIIEFIMNTPSHHRVHHGRNEYCLDKNYGGIFIVFDRLYGTFEPEQELVTEDPITKEKSDVVYGLTAPLNSFDPIQSQHHSLVSIFKTCRKISSKSSSAIFNGKSELFIWWNRLQVVFRGPGWDIFSQTWYECPPVLVPPSKNKVYDPEPQPSYEKHLATVHFVLIAFFYLLHMETKFGSSLQHLIQFLFIYFSFSSVSGIYENDISKSLFELFRLSFTNVFLLLKYFGLSSGAILPGSYAQVFGANLFGFTSMGWVLFFVNSVSLVYWFSSKQAQTKK